MGTARHIIVDGYNVIRADPRLQSLERVSLEHARVVLAQTLASAPRLANDRITIVFDGTYGTRSHIHSGHLGRVEMLYSARGQTADEVIVDQVGDWAITARVVVVTNDGEVRDRCRAIGAEVTGSENLLNQIPGRRQPARQDDDDDTERTLSTIKRGNPRKASKRERRQSDIRF